MNETNFKGTVQEYQEMTKTKSVVEKKSRIDSSVHPRISRWKYDRTGKVWSKKELSLLKRNANLPMKKLCRILDRDKNAIKIRKKVLRI